MKYRNSKLTNVEQSFKELPETGAYEKFEKLHYYANIVPDHVQGYSRGKVDNTTYYVFTHNMSARDDGRVLICRSLKGKNDECDTGSGWNHPGGCQVLGRVCFVPCEKDGISSIEIYDLPDHKRIKTIGLSHKASAVGITDVKINESEYYLMAVISQLSYCYFYIASENFDFKQIGQFSLENQEYENPAKNNEKGKVSISTQGIGLVTSTDNKVYMVLLESDYNGSKATYDDWAYLLPLDVTVNSVQRDRNKKILGRHFIYNGGIFGVDGSHFRWGAGIEITPDGKLVLLATSRNIIAGKKSLNTTYWKKS